MCRSPDVEIDPIPDSGRRKVIYNQDIEPLCTQGSNPLGAIDAEKLSISVIF